MILLLTSKLSYRFILLTIKIINAFLEIELAELEQTSNNLIFIMHVIN